MNFSYLTIFLLLILFFLYMKLENNNNKITIYTLGIIVVLLVHEIYMYIGLNKTENFQVEIGNINRNIQDEEILEPVNNNTELYNIVLNNNFHYQNPNDLLLTDKFVDFIPINNHVLVYNNKLNVSSKNAFLFLDDGELNKPIQISETDDKYDCAALYYNTYALFAGGINDDGVISNKINFYDMANDTLSLVQIDKGRHKMNCSQNEDYIVFAFGLNDDNKISKRIDYYIKTKNNIVNSSNWESLSCPYPGKLYSKVLIHKNKLYIIGGFDGTEFKNNIYIYAFDKDNWSKININLIKNTHNLQAEIVEYRSRNRIYILGSNNSQKNFYHKKLLFSLTNEPKSYVYEEREGKLTESTVDNFSSNEIFLSENMNDSHYNYSYLGEYIPKIYKNLSTENYTISMWLYIDRSNSGNTKLIMGDYNLCTGVSSSKNNYTCLILHNNRILPCIKLDKKLLIKNNDEIPEVEYDKWFHYVASINNPEPISTTTSLPSSTEHFESSCVFSETLRPQETTITTPAPGSINNKYQVFSYINGKKTVTEFNTVLKFNETTQTLTVDGFDSFNQQREYANNTKLANLKIFNGVLDQGTIYDILKNENNFYNNSNPELVYMDIDKKTITSPDFNLTGNNCLMQSFNKQNLKIISTNMEFDYDIKKVSEPEKKKTEHINENVFDLLRLTNGIVKIAYAGNLLNITKYDMNVSENLKCAKGEYIEDNQCKRCPVNSYSDGDNMFDCKPCPEKYSTNGQTGQSKCVADEEFINEDTNIVIDKNLIGYLRNKSLSHETAMKKVNEMNIQVRNMEKNLEIINKNIV